MSKWIDYDNIDYRNDRLHDKSEEFLNGVIYMAQRIEEAPTIDIVRCKDCKWYEKEWCYCGLHNNADKDIKPTDFCSYGERIRR